MEEEIRATFYSIGDGVISTDAAGRVTRMNPVAEQLPAGARRRRWASPLSRSFTLSTKRAGPRSRTLSRASCATGRS